MSISSFLLKLRYGSYKNSSRAASYEEIAAQFHVSPQHVYALNHGKTVRTRVDADICDEFLVRAFRKVGTKKQADLESKKCQQTNKQLNYHLNNQ